MEKPKREALIEHAKAIYAKHGFPVLTVSKRIENQPPSGYNRGDSCIHILRSLFGVDWEERVKVHKQMATTDEGGDILLTGF